MYPAATAPIAGAATRVVTGGAHRIGHPSPVVCGCFSERAGDDVTLAGCNVGPLDGGHVAPAASVDVAVPGRSGEVGEGRGRPSRHTSRPRLGNRRPGYAATVAPGGGGDLVWLTDRSYAGVPQAVARVGESTVTVMAPTYWGVAQLAWH
ncbi:hypothetical protein E2562_026887 [Oryza meyeriana var. granulata]|uniref:Uncharacterized protein n=1 Tax=Oryza meyeriana var. granulata TaxID=110450 RepID=A0A6G1EPJ8_9ORYZ|nr:hypothetical protein E2562_026887 [Oryza meyeriana var. granulata]